MPDNTWLKEMFELGILGLWFLVLMVVAMFVAIRRTERRSSGIDRDFLSGAAAQLLAIAMASLVATYLELVPMDQLFWVMIAVAATMEPQTPTAPAVYRPGVQRADRAPRRHGAEPHGPSRPSQRSFRHASGPEPPRDRHRIREVAPLT